MRAEGRLDGADPSLGLCVGDRIGEARAQAGGDSRRCGAPQRVAPEKGIPEERGRLGGDRFPLEPHAKRRRVGIRALATLVAREVDVGQVEDRRLAPALGGLFVEFPEQGLVDGLGADAGADDGLDAIDQAAADDGVALLHAELEGPGVEVGIALGRLRVEETHVLDQALMDHRVDLGQSNGKGLIEPDDVVDRLVFEGTGLVFARRPTDLEGEGLDPLVDIALHDLDGARRGRTPEARLQCEEQTAQDQEMEKRCTQQARPFRRLGSGYRNPMDRASSSATAARNLALVDRYFELLQKGDAAIAELFAKDARWLAPQSSPVGRLHDGLDAVLALMASGLGLYDTTRPMQIERTSGLAGEEIVYVEMTIRATTGQGEPYENHYVMVFQIRDGRIAEVREHVDSLYAQRLLFDPVGQRSPLDTRAH